MSYYFLCFTASDFEISTEKYSKWLYWLTNGQWPYMTSSLNKIWSTWNYIEMCLNMEHFRCVAFRNVSTQWETCFRETERWNVTKSKRLPKITEAIFFQSVDGSWFVTQFCTNHGRKYLVNSIQLAEFWIFVKQYRDIWAEDCISESWDARIQACCFLNPERLLLACVHLL